MYKKIAALLLALVMVLGIAACTKPAEDPKPNEPVGETKPTETTKEPEAPVVEEVEGVDYPVVFEGDYTYNDSVSTMATNWNPHTYQTTDDSYPADFLRTGFYTFVFNDEINAVEGKDPYAGYKIIPELAADFPEDITAAAREAYPQFNIPADVDSGYAYKIKLNPLATWEDGTPIKAADYVYSAKRLLAPELLNYRAADYIDQDISIAGAKAFYNGGSTAYTDLLGGLAREEWVLGEDGQYVTPDGLKLFLGLNVALDWCGGSTLKDYVDGYGEQYFAVENWPALMELMGTGKAIPLTDANIELFLPIITGNPAWGETDADIVNYIVTGEEFPVIEFEGNVGVIATDEYELTLVFDKSLKGFYLLYNLSGTWLVKEDLYEANLTEAEGVWTSTYNTNVATTSSFGPYKLTEYQTDKFMKFEKNENWYGWTDGKHVYIDPEDGLLYNMYQTTTIETQVVAESATRKLMFLKGELMTFGLGSEDIDTYRNSEYCYVTPSETIFFLILNGHKDAIAEREAAADFDTTKYDLEMLTNLNFHKALGVTYDKENFAATVSPARSGGYGIIGTNYIYDPETGAKYRDTDQAKQVLCDFYAVDVSKFASLDEAAASITGYDPVAAAEFYKAAFADGIEAGYITDNDGDGISDQIVRIEYAISSDSDFMTKTINYLNEKVSEVVKGTPFEGKVEFVKSAPYGNDWSTKIRNGMADTVLGGWSGSALNPFGIIDCYVNPSKQYDAAWFDASKVTATFAVNGKDVTMSLRQWSDCLSGTAIEIDGVTYNFGDGQVSVEERLNILAMLEGQILSTYNYLPTLQDGGMSLLTQKAYYIVEEYNPIMGRGGITYLKYNYNDAEWTAYVAEQGGELKY